MSKYLSKAETLGKILGIIVAVVIVFGILGLLLQLLWGWIVVPIFGIGAITFWQAVGIILLLTILRIIFK